MEDLHLPYSTSIALGATDRVYSSNSSLACTKFNELDKALENTGECTYIIDPFWVKGDVDDWDNCASAVLSEVLNANESLFDSHSADPSDNIIAKSFSRTSKDTLLRLSLGRIDINLQSPQVLILLATPDLASKMGEVVNDVAKYTIADRWKKPPRGTKLVEQIVIGTPGIVLDWASKYKFFDPKKIKLFILDEAEVMIDIQGYCDQSIRLCRLLNKRTCQQLLFATQLESPVKNFVEKVVEEPFTIISRPKKSSPFFEERERLKSFEGSWSYEGKVSSEALAKAGFYYLGPEDIVLCVFCDGKLQGWEHGDDPLEKHARWFPSCPKFGGPMSHVPCPNRSTGTDSGILRIHQIACNPHFDKKAFRLESFRNRWPSNLSQSIDELSSAGFFYVGCLDSVKCFFCDGMISNWQDHNEPWTEHARLFPNCGFLQSVKGSSFVDAVNESLAPSTPSTTTMITSITERPMEGSCYMQKATTCSHKIVLERINYLEAVNFSLKEENVKLKKENVSINLKNISLEGENFSLEGENFSLQGENFSLEGVNVSLQGENFSLKEENLSLKGKILYHNEQEGVVSQENLKLRKICDERNCKICMDDEHVASIVFIPCRHLAVCSRCLPYLECSLHSIPDCLNCPKICPICREDAFEIVSTYLA